MRSLVAITLLLLTACGGSDPRHATELALEAAASTEYGAWHAARNAMNVARREAGEEAITNRQEALRDAQAALREAQAKRDARFGKADADLARVIGEVNAQETREKERERPNAQSRMDEVYARLREAHRAADRNEPSSVCPGLDQELGLRMTVGVFDNERRDFRGNLGPWRPRIVNTTGAICDEVYRETHQRAWADYHAAGGRAEAKRREVTETADREKAAADEELEASRTAAQAMYDAAGTPAVLAFEAAFAAETSAREGLARAAPQAWVAFVAAERSR